MGVRETNENLNANRQISSKARCFSTLIMLPLVLVLISCGSETREEVFERYHNGRKKVLHVYSGSGADEILIETRRYSRKGQLVRIDDKASGETKHYYEISSDLFSREGIREFLSGTKWERSLSNGKDYIEFTRDSTFYSMKVNDTGISTVIDYSGANYVRNMRIERHNEGVIRDTLKVLPLTESKIEIPNFRLFDDETLVFKKTDKSAKEMVVESR